MKLSNTQRRVLERMAVREVLYLYQEYHFDDGTIVHWNTFNSFYKRGWVEAGGYDKASDRFTYVITDAGREAIGESDG